MKIIEFYVGTTVYHSADRVSEKKIMAWEDHLIDTYGGFSRWTVDGAWREADICPDTLREQSYVYRIGTDAVDTTALVVECSEWASRLDQYVIGLIVQDCEIAAF